jgi:formylglycine-generating enzyme required for sulfatase activity
MGRIVFFFSALTFCLVSLFAQDSVIEQQDYNKVGHIYPANGSIKIETRRGHIYKHYEGTKPNWHIGLLEDIAIEHPVVDGDGSIYVFSPITSSDYQVVEEEEQKGILQLSLDSNLKDGFQYVIREGDNNILSEFVSETDNIPPVPLPFGEYTVQVIATGFDAQDPVPFAIDTDDYPINVAMTLSQDSAKLVVLGNPFEITAGSKVVVRQIDADTHTVDKVFEVDIGEVLTVSEGQYTVEFPEIEKYTRPGTHGILGKYNIDVESSPVRIVGNYELNVGDLVVSCATPEGNNLMKGLSCKIIDSQGQEQEHLFNKDDVENGVWKLKLSDLYPDDYAVSFSHTANILDFPESRIIHVEGDTAEVSHEFLLKDGTLEASIDISPGAKINPEMFLVDSSGDVVLATEEGSFSSVSLRPGDYTLTFKEIAGFVTPKDIDFTIAPNELSGPFVGEYNREVGTVVVTYDTGPRKDNLDRIRFWLVDSEGNRTMYPQEEEYVDDFYGYTRTVCIDDLSDGDFSLDFVVPNQDGLFDEVEPIEFTKGVENILITHSFQPKYGKVVVDLDTAYVTEALEKPFVITLLDSEGKAYYSSEGSLECDSLIPGDYQIVFEQVNDIVSPTPIAFSVSADEELDPFLGIYGAEVGYFSVTTNENFPWVLYRGEHEVLRGKDSKELGHLPVGSYSLVAAPVHGHIAKIIPEGIFEVGKEQTIHTSINYQEVLGIIILDVPMRTGETVSVSLDPIDESGMTTEPISWDLVTENNKLFYHDENIPAGRYSIFFDLPPEYQKIPEKIISVGQGDVVTLSPELLGYRYLEVNTNHSGADFTLKDYDHDLVIGQGRGEYHTFSALVPGKYVLEFAELSSADYKVPESQIIDVGAGEDRQIFAEYHPQGVINLSANVDNFDVRIEQVNDGTVIEERITEQNKDIYLPVGHYQISFLALEGELSKRYSDNQLSFLDVEVRSGSPENIHGVYVPRTGSIIVTTNLPDAVFSVNDVTELGKSFSIGRYRGDNVVIPATKVGNYEIVFEEVNNFKTPGKVIVKISDGKREIVGGNYVPKAQVSLVAAGQSVVGDVFGDGAPDERPSRTIELNTFLIGLHPVTNGEYAQWLNTTYKAGQIKYVSEDGFRGQVQDLKGRLLCETYESDHDSQIMADISGDEIFFVALESKEYFPVIEVSWYGADTYCRDNGYRLPTEAEWERAAGMTIVVPGQPLKKYRYGFSRNDIDNTWANYMEHYAGNDSVGTTEIGFYNGINTLDYGFSVEEMVKDDPVDAMQKYGTHLAKSPCGSFDMSGNVREWVGDWYSDEYYPVMPDRNPLGPDTGIKKVTKGGSYNDPAYELRVSARVPLSLETTDAYTGFRIAIDYKS